MSATLTAAIGRIVESVVDDALSGTRAGDRPDSGAVAREAAAAVEPAVRHATNGEPWYQSRVTWGAIVSLATPLLALAGWELAADDREAVVSAIVALGPAIGAGLTLYGRWVASRPIGA